jgi:L-fuconolactonase
MFQVDAHHHLWDLSVRDQPWISDDRIRRTFTIDDLAAVAHVDATVVVQTVSVPEETPELLAIEHPLIAGVVGWIDLTAADAGERLAALRCERLVGVRHQVQDEPDPRWLCRRDVRAGLAAVAREGLVYDLLTIPSQLPAAIETVHALGDLQFVVDHLSKPPIATGELEPWASQLRALAAHENVACKLSGMVTEADWATWTVDALRPYAEVALDAFGADRVLFGSDWPVCLLAASHADVTEAAEALTAQLSAAEREQIFGGTARRIYTLR